MPRGSVGGPMNGRQQRTNIRRFRPGLLCARCGETLFLSHTPLPLEGRAWAHPRRCHPLPLPTVPELSGEAIRMFARGTRSVAEAISLKLSQLTLTELAAASQSRGDRHDRLRDPYDAMHRKLRAIDTNLGDEYAALRTHWMAISTTVQ